MPLQGPNYSLTRSQPLRTIIVSKITKMSRSADVVQLVQE